MYFQLTKAYQDELVASKAIPMDTIFAIFSNTTELLDFQRRFLIALEGTLSLGPNEHRVGSVFLTNVF
jgi:hypothetical protein